MYVYMYSLSTTTLYVYTYAIKYVQCAYVCYLYGTILCARSYYYVHVHPLCLFLGVTKTKGNSSIEKRGQKKRKCDQGVNG